MTPQRLLDRLNTLGASVTTDGTSLNVKAAKGSISRDLLTEIKSHKAALIEVLSKPPSKVFPQSFNQAQLWFLQQLEPDSAMYNNPLALMMEGPLDVLALQRSFDAVIRRHAILRTTFFDREGEPAQKVFDEPLCALELTSLTDVAERNHADERDARIQNHASRPFDLKNEAGVRLELLHVDQDTHALLLNVHHICADGWSVGILLNEILDGYFAREGCDTQPTVEPLAMQYGDFALAQRKKFGPEDIKRQKTYWVSQLDGVPELLTLPSDRPRPAEQSFLGAHLNKQLPSELKPKINSIAHQTGATAFAVFLAVHAIVMTRNSGQDDICIGSSFAGRDDIKLEPLIGHFINTVALRIKLAENPAFADLVHSVQQSILGAMEHQDLPFDKVVEAINPVRSTDHTPLFQTMLIYQNTPKAAPASDGKLTITPISTNSATAKYDLTIELFETSDSFELGAEYRSDIFNAESVERWLGQFETVLRAALENPETRIGALPIDKSFSLVGPAFAHDRDRTLHGWFDETARAHPHSTAVQDDTNGLSFAELATRQSELASVLVEHGCQPGTAVALLLEPDIDYVAAMLAVFKVGGCIVPIPPQTPIARIRHFLKDAAVQIIMTRSTDHETIIAAGFTGPVLSPDASPNATHSPATQSVNADAVAAIIYTSGSTGIPKCSRMTHRSLVNLINWTQQQFPINGAVVQKSSIGFDASLWEFLWPLMAGHCLHVVQGEARTDPSLLGQHLEGHAVAVLQFVPATLRLFLDGLSAGSLQGLSHIFCGGGELTRDLADETLHKLPNVTLVNVYGVTECAVDSVFHIYDPKIDDLNAVPIGRPIANTSVLLLDKKGREVPKGAVGEICIGGVGTSTGYLNHPSDAFSDRLIGRAGPWFKTGDLARLDQLGRLEFVGRKDFQIKLNGFRIEPAEIEHSLQRAGCSAALVMVFEGTLIAYVTDCDDPIKVKSKLAEILPSYMIPSIICPLAAFPLNASGKINRAALPPPTQATPINAVNQTTPRDAVEMTLYEIWKSVLLHPTIGIRDNFFDIGGSSISAIKLLHKLKKTTGQVLSLRDVITHPTIEELAALLRNSNAESHTEDGRITFRKGAGQVNVVCVHPAGGTAFCYLSLAKALSQEVGVYGVQSLGLNPDEMLSPTVETMAAHYLELIGDLLDAPVIITGLSFGGLVAHEMGRVLSARGKRDVSVVLLDTQGTDDAELRQRIDVIEMDEFRDKLVRFNGTYPGISDAQIELYFNVYNHNRLAVRDYAVPVSGARTVFIQALSDLPRYFLHEVRRFWKGRTTNGLTSRLVRGDHWDMLETAELRIVTKMIAQEIATLTRGHTEGK